MIVNASDFTIVERHGDLAIARKNVGREGWTVIRMNGDNMLMDLANRPTEAAIRKEANYIWKQERAAGRA